MGKEAQGRWGFPFPFSLQLEVTKEACSSPENVLLARFPWAFWNFHIKMTKEGVCDVWRGPELQDRERMSTRKDV